MAITLRVILIRGFIEVSGEIAQSVLNRDGRKQIRENEQRQLFKGVLLERERKMEMTARGVGSGVCLMWEKAQHI